MKDASKNRLLLGKRKDPPQASVDLLSQQEQDEDGEDNEVKSDDPVS